MELHDAEINSDNMPKRLLASQQIPTEFSLIFYHKDLIIVDVLD